MFAKLITRCGCTMDFIVPHDAGSQPPREWHAPLRREFRLEAEVVPPTYIDVETRIFELHRINNLDAYGTKIAEYREKVQPSETAALKAEIARLKKQVADFNYYPIRPGENIDSCGRY